jgi:hypothetical protein
LRDGLAGCPLEEIRGEADQGWTLLRHDAGNRLDVESAGAMRGTVRPETISAMRGLGIAQKTRNLLNGGKAGKRAKLRRVPIEGRHICRSRTDVVTGTD